MLSFGQVLKRERERAGIRQKDLAARIIKPDGTPISAVYLHDLENDRRQPPSDFLIEQLATGLGLPDANILFYFAGRIPPAFRAYSKTTIPAITKAFQFFLDELKRSSA